MKWLKGIALTIGALLAIALVLVAWLLNTQSGARWSAQMASDALGAKLDIGAVEGTIAGPLVLTNVRYRDPGVGVDATIQRATLDVALQDLARSLVRVNDARLQGVSVLLHTPAAKPAAEEPAEPFTFDPPIDILIERFAAADVIVRRDESVLIELTRALFVGHWTSADLAVERLEVRSPQGEVDLAARVDQQGVYVGEATGRFTWRVGERTYAGALATTADEKDIALQLDLSQPLEANVDAVVAQSRTWDRALFNIEARVPDTQLAAEGVATTDAVALSKLQVTQGRGRLDAQGRVQFKPHVAWNLDAEARHLDPGKFAAQWPGDLNFALVTEGRITPEGPTAKLQLAELAGELRGRKLSGAGDLAISPQRVPSGILNLRSGRSVLEFRGREGDAVDAALALDIASLNDWIPDAGGALHADFDVRGAWPALSLDGAARGKDINVANVRMAKLAVDADVDDPRNPQGAVTLDVDKLSAAGLQFESLQARASGGMEAHQLTVNANGAPLAFDVALQGARTKRGWAGDIQQLTIAVQDAARLQLREPVHVVAEAGAIDISQACLTDEPIVVCAQGRTNADGSLQATYSLADVPLALANVFASGESPLRFAGALEGRGDVRRTAQGALSGQAVIGSASGSVSRHVVEVEGEAPDEAQTVFTWRDLRVAASFDGPNARATVSAQVLDKGSISGEAAIRGLGEDAAPLAGRLSATLPDLAPFAVFAPQVANVHGRADARFELAGTLQAPRVSGEVTARELAADVPAVGLHLKNGELTARPTPSNEIAFAGRIDSGEGRVQLEGVARQGGAIEARVQGERFLAADIPAARVIITPALELVRTAERTTLSGEVTIPEAAVNLQKLPRGGDKARAASPDVVIVDAKTRDEEVEETPLFANVTVILGDKVELTGFGLQAKIDGRLDVHEQPGEPTVGSGQVIVAGKYKAYGQDLTIEQGRLLYANTPLDNPRLNIEATRQVEDVIAGLRVRGSAKKPELTVFSDPPMTQANALSYIVAGKPLDDIGADEGEGDALQAATRSLGAAAGGLLAKNIGRRLGVDELAVKDDEMLGGSALTIGQYLSPRLYLSYGVGLFEPGEVVTLRYKLSEDLDVKAQTGPKDTRAGIEYRIER